MGMRMDFQEHLADVTNKFDAGEGGGGVMDWTLFVCYI